MDTRVIAFMGLVGCAWALVAILFDYLDRPRYSASKRWPR